MSNIEPAANLGASIAKIRQRSVELLEKNDVKGCWALLDQLCPSRFFYRLGLTSPYSGGKGKPRDGTKRPYGGEHSRRPLLFDTDQLSPEDRVTFCKLEEEKQRQGALCKEAAAKAAVAVEQTKILLKIASIQKKQAEIEKEVCKHASMFP